MDLNEIERSFAEQFQRALQLLSALRFSGRSDLRGEEKFVVQLEFGRDLAGHRFCLTICWRRVDEFPAHLYERGHDLLERAAVGRSLIENVRGPQPDYRQHLARAR